MMNDQEISDFLVSSTGLQLETLREFYALGETKSIKKKQLLAEPGKPIRKAYFLIDGIVRHYVVGQDEEEFTKHFMKSPNFVVASIPGFFLQTEDTLHCEALTEIVVHEWSYDQLMKFAMSEPKFMHFLMKFIVTVYRQKEQKEISLHTQNAKERYRKFQKDYPDIAYIVPLKHVASFLNIRPETLSRIRASR